MVPERLEKGIKQEKQVLVVLGVGIETKNINLNKAPASLLLWNRTKLGGGGGGDEWVEVEEGGLGGGSQPTLTRGKFWKRGGTDTEKFLARAGDPLTKTLVLFWDTVVHHYLSTENTLPYSIHICSCVELYGV